MQFTELAQQLGALLKRRSLKIVTAESCTGGMLAAAITSISGSSQWFERGFVTYSNESKMELLQVERAIIERYGAVSEQVAGAMAEGALKNSHADVSVAITGIAGPDGGTDEKPVGLVWFGFAGKEIATQCVQKHFSGDRADVRAQAVAFALNLPVCR